MAGWRNSSAGLLRSACRKGPPGHCFAVRFASRQEGAGSLARFKQLIVMYLGRQRETPAYGQVLIQR